MRPARHGAAVVEVRVAVFNAVLGAKRDDHACVPPCAGDGHDAEEGVSGKVLFLDKSGRVHEDDVFL
jgi:hypothetical protein